MAKRPVLVVHQTFVLKGRIVNRGEVISDPEEIAIVRANHPEKAVASHHDHDDPVEVPAEE